MKRLKDFRESLEIGTDEIVDAYKKATPGEAVDPADQGEYDNEGQMAKTQLRGIVADASHMIQMFSDEQNLPEWVQNKITKAADYLNSAHRYMMNKESVEWVCGKCSCEPCICEGNNLEEKYRPPTQAEIDADKKKDRKAQRAAGKRRPSMSTKSISKKMYGNMKGGLKEEDLQELDAKTQKKFAAGAKNMKAYAQKNGGVDKKDFMDVAKLLDQIARVNLLQAGQLLSRLNRLVDGMDTDVRERIYVELQKVGLVEELEEKKAPKIDDKKYAAHMARNKKPKKMTSTQKSLSDIQKRANEEVDERKLSPKEIKKALASAKAKAKPKSQVSLKKAPFEIPESLEEKLQVSDGMAKWIEDFQASDAPQFKGKDKNERREMAIAAYLAAKRREKKED
jgi:hypothetical protein